MDLAQSWTGGRTPLESTEGVWCCEEPLSHTLLCSKASADMRASMLMMLGLFCGASAEVISSALHICETSASQK